MIGLRSIALWRVRFHDVRRIDLGLGRFRVLPLSSTLLALLAFVVLGFYILSWYLLLNLFIF